MNIAFYTLGCKVNQYETQALREKFALMGHNIVSEREDFDCIVVNSCTVTAESDRKCRQMLNRFRRQNPNAVILLTGCMVQALGENAKELDVADVIVGNSDTEKIPELAEKFLKDRESFTHITPHTRNECFSTPEITRFDERTRAFMKIEDGCERYCTYCIIPYARGFVRSRSPQSIKKEACALAENGYKEIVLVGINLSAYGKGENINLCDAVDTVCEVDGIERVRLGSLEPDHISDEMLERFKTQEKFCPQFHLSLQSGCDATLKRMNRHYDSAFYYDLVTRIRNIFPDAAISTDIMVGFAGETEEEFSQSMAFLKKVGFSKTHVFSYSRRAGTVADKMPNQVTNAVKAERSRKMIASAEECEKQFLDSLKGKTFPVLFETFEEGKNLGYTPNYARVCVNTDTDLSGSIINIKITETEKDLCFGEII